MKRSIIVRLLWEDVHAVEIRLSVWTGTFGGTVDIYGGHEIFQEIAANLEGFPRNVSDVRDFSVGSFGPEFAGGGAKLKFFCTGAAGRVRIEGLFESEHQANHVQRVSFNANVEAAAIDDFVTQLRAIQVRSEEKAELLINTEAADL